MTQVTPTIMRSRNITFNSLGSKTCKTLVHGKKYYIFGKLKDHITTTGMTTE